MKNKRMEILLDEFEQQVDETVLKRGFDCFKKGYVTEVDEFGDGEYEITVTDSEVYVVNLAVNGNVVTDFECDCLYDGGSICKHVVAALFYLQKDVLETVKKEQNKSKEKPITEELLEILSHEALKIFVGNICANDDRFRKLFVAEHAHLISTVSKELYTKQVRLLINTYSDRHGFVGYSDAKLLGRAVCEIAEEAKRNLEEGKIRMAVLAALAIVEEMVQLLNYNADDSNGEIGGSIECAFEIFEMLTKMDLDKTQHEELFDHLVSLFEDNTLKGWDWHFKIISLAIELLETAREKERIKAVLGKIKPSDNKWDWDYERSQQLMLDLIQKTENAEAVIRYMENNLSNSQFRIRLIEAALSRRDYAKACKLANEGVIKDGQDAPGLADQWRNYLLIIYQEANDTENIILLTRYFLTYSNGQYHPLKYYYDILKNLIPGDQWDVFFEGLVTGIKKKDFSCDYERISQLYIWEEYWDKLLELLQQNTSLERIAEAEPYLADSYSNELASLYKTRILSYLEHNMGRTYYQIACQYIQRMMILGARPMAMDLIRQLRNIYSGRRALTDELNKI
ncbi:MAG: hypothetical protein LBR26_12845 [Prevotella sp.]|jgi:hypothetical protein|nr:hypothetical protein [Prevotella sp.]